MVRDLISEVLAGQQYDERLKSLPKGEQDAVLAVAQTELDTMVQRGTIMDEENLYTISASYNNGQLLVNEAPVSLPFLELVLDNISENTKNRTQQDQDAKR